MPPRKRLSIADRNKAAIAHDTPEPLPEKDEGEQTATPPAAPTKAQKTLTKQKKTTAARTSSDTARLGVYISTDEYEDAKAAYVTAYARGGQIDNFARWIAAALNEHAARTTAQRAKHARMKERSPWGKGKAGASRSFAIPTDTLERMQEAMDDDLIAGQWPTRSEWAGDAIAAAVEAARAEGPLLDPPKRLPNRLKRGKQRHTLDR